MLYGVLVGSGIEETDKELFFGPLEPDDVFITLPDTTRWPELLVTCGIFNSTSQARKCGWNKDIPDGWSDITIGKLRTNICVLKILE